MGSDSCHASDDSNSRRSPPSDGSSDNMGRDGDSQSCCSGGGGGSKTGNKKNNSNLENGNHHPSNPEDASTGAATGDVFPACSDIPPECSSTIFSYLELKDVLKVGSTSLSSLREVLPDLVRRREKLTRRFAYWRNDWKGVGLHGNVSGTLGGDGIVGNEKISLWDDVKGDECGADWVPMPTVQERVDQLYKHMPEDHGCYQSLQELRHDLRVDVDRETVKRCPKDFGLVLKMQRKILRSSRLHSFILEHAIHSCPLEYENSTTLDQYMGDVLCVTYLINQSNLGIVEGSPTNSTFVNALRRMESEGSSCYTSWVYMHSCILRIKPFTSDQRHRLGIPDFLGVSEMLPNGCCINEFFMSSEMKLVFSEFGPLGPAFRGRDVVRLRDIPARRIFAFFATNDSSLHLAGETTRGALEWLCLLHEQSRKVRPMTVKAPVVRLCLGASVEA